MRAASVINVIEYADAERFMWILIGNSPTNDPSAIGSEPQPRARIPMRKTAKQWQTEKNGRPDSVVSHTRMCPTLCSYLSR